MGFVYDVDLKDGISPEAKKAAQAVLTLESALKSTTNALTKANALGNVAQHNKLTEASEKLSTALGQEKDKLDAAMGGSDKYGSALDIVKGKSGAAAGEAGGLGEALGAVPWAAAAAAAAAFVLALAAVTAKMMAMSLEAVDAKNKLTAMFDAVGGGVTSGKATVQMLDDLSTKVGMTREQLAPLATEIEGMGVRSLPELQAQLKAAASATAIMGDQGRAAYMQLTSQVLGASAAHQKFKMDVKSLASQFAHMGLSVQDVAQAMGISTDEFGKAMKGAGVDADKLGTAIQTALATKGKGALDASANSFAFLKQQFTANVMHLFENVNTKPLIDGLKKLSDVFFGNTNSAKVFKSVITGAMNGIFSAAAKVIPYIVTGIEKLIIVGLKIAIGWKYVGKAAKDAWDAIGGGKTVLTVIKALLTPLAVPFYAIAAGAVAVVGAIKMMIKTGASILGWAKGAASAAKDLISGLVGGIKSGAGLVISAIKGLGSSAIGALKGVLGIHSPSKVMMELGGHTGTGFAQGVEQSVPKVSGAAGSLGTAAAMGAAKGAAPAASGRGNMTVTIESIAIDGAGKAAMQITEEMVSTVFEKIGLAAGYG